MGWSIKTNNKDEWSLYSSISEGNIETFKTQKELVDFIALEQIYQGKKKAIETLMTFPDGWYVNGKRTFVDNRTELLKQYYDWFMSIVKLKSYEEYYKAIDDKLKELIK